MDLPKGISLRDTDGKLPIVRHIIIRRRSLPQPEALSKFESIHRVYIALRCKHNLL